MSNTKSQRKPRNSILISSNEFNFGKMEFGFIRRHAHWLYPRVMGEMIDFTRELMRWIQNKAKTRYFFTLDRHHPDDRPMYHISEMLHTQASEPVRGFVSVQPVELERKREFRSQSNADGGYRQITFDLTNEKNREALREFQVYGEISALALADALIQYISEVQQDTFIRQYYFSLQDNPGIAFDVGHTASHSHYVRIRFDFFKPQAVPDEGLAASAKLPPAA